MRFPLGLDCSLPVSPVMLATALVATFGVARQEVAPEPLEKLSEHAHGSDHVADWERLARRTSEHLRVATKSLRSAHVEARQPSAPSRAELIRTALVHGRSVVDAIDDILALECDHRGT